MRTTTLLGALTFCGLAALLSCDQPGSQTTGRLSDDDCPIGTFKPPGLADCVIPADDMFGSPLGVSDNRCVSGQPAFPPVCQSDMGGRTYFATSKSCAPDYRYLPGACQRGGGAGSGGFAGTSGFAGVTGAAGDIGAAGVMGFDPTGGVMTGGAGTGFGTGTGTATGSGPGEAAASGTMTGAAGSPISTDASLPLPN